MVCHFDNLLGLVFTGKILDFTIIWLDGLHAENNPPIVQTGILSMLRMPSDKNCSFDKTRWRMSLWYQKSS